MFCYGRHLDSQSVRQTVRYFSSFREDEYTNYKYINQGGLLSQSLHKYCMVCFYNCLALLSCILVGENTSKTILHCINGDWTHCFCLSKPFVYLCIQETFTALTSFVRKMKIKFLIKLEHEKYSEKKFLQFLFIYTK